MTKLEEAKERLRVAQEEVKEAERAIELNHEYRVLSRYAEGERLKRVAAIGLELKKRLETLTSAVEQYLKVDGSLGTFDEIGVVEARNHLTMTLRYVKGQADNAL